VQPRDPGLGLLRDNWPGSLARYRFPGPRWKPLHLADPAALERPRRILYLDHVSIVLLSDNYVAVAPEREHVLQGVEIQRGNGSSKEPHFGVPLVQQPEGRTRLPVVVEQDRSVTQTDEAEALDAIRQPPASHVVPGPINDDVSNTIIAQLLFLDADNPERDIYLYINSPGGIVCSGMAIYDTMQCPSRETLSTRCTPGTALAWASICMVTKRSTSAGPTPG